MYTDFKYNTVYFVTCIINCQIYFKLTEKMATKIFEPKNG